MAELWPPTLKPPALDRLFHQGERRYLIRIGARSLPRFDSPVKDGRAQPRAFGGHPSLLICRFGNPFENPPVWITHIRQEHRAMKPDNQWADYADSFDSLDEYSHFLPDVFDLLGDMENRRILDLGCSNGVMCRLLASKGARLTGVDRSEHAIAVAEALTRESEVEVFYQVADAMDLSMFDDASFDVVVAVNTLCSFGADRNSMRAIVEEIHRVLKNEGSLVAVLPHPAFEHRQNCPTRRRAFPADYCYFHGGTENILSLVVGDGQAEFTNVHWSLEDYTGFFRDRFVISDIREPEPDDRFESLHPRMFENESSYPIYLLLKCLKSPVTGPLLASRK